MAYRRAGFIAVLAIGLGIAGCGSDTAVQTGSGELTTLKPTTGAGAGAGQQYQAPGAPQAGSEEAAKALVKDVSAAFQALQGYSGSIECTDAKDGTGKQIISKANVKFMKPEQIRVDLTFNSDDPKKAGTKAVWKGGDTMKVKPSGLLGFAKVDLAIGDTRLLTENGWKINQFSLKANIDTLTNPSAKVKYMGRSQLANYTLALADVSGPLKMTKADHIKMGIDINTKLPVYAEYLQGTKLLYSMRLLNVSMTPPSAADFEL
ncbi:MAG: hypothetical protein FJZ01_04365 [Candidatus Sericytochromatia bacterium]|nr:hypothetical protein [Candidatus Tanganyikabacteria bacterium]